MSLIRNGVAIDDAWVRLDDDTPAAPGSRAIVSLQRWKAEKSRLTEILAGVGVLLKSSESAEDIADDLSVLEVVDGAYRLTDVTGESRLGRHAIVPVVTFKDGVAFDMTECVAKKVELSVVESAANARLNWPRVRWTAGRRYCSVPINNVFELTVDGLKSSLKQLEDEAPEESRYVSGIARSRAKRAELLQAVIIGILRYNKLM